ncbi:MAG: hypothetical protein JNN07_19665 [Verrucomicrobiales bacterium]|nr:hypothetical protein [Verrucomicrobiales bacterium]
MQETSSITGRAYEIARLYCRRNAKFIIWGFILLAAGLGAWFLVFESLRVGAAQFHGLRRFVRMSAPYHQEFATACEQLYRTTPDTNLLCTIRGSDGLVPEPLRAVSPATIQVGHDRVTVISGGDFGGFGIHWRLRNPETSRDSWVLEANPGRPAVVVASGKIAIPLPRRGAGSSGK